MASELKKTGFLDKNINFVALSGLRGDNLTSKSEAFPWYSGPHLVEAMDNLSSIKTRVDQPLRISILDFFRSDGLGTVAICKIM